MSAKRSRVQNGTTHLSGPLFVDNDPIIMLGGHVAVQSLIGEAVRVGIKLPVYMLYVESADRSV